MLLTHLHLGIKVGCTPWLLYHWEYPKSHNAAIASKTSKGTLLKDVHGQLSSHIDSLSLPLATLDLRRYNFTILVLVTISPFCICRHTVKKHEKAQGFTKSYIAQIRRKQNIPEVSYPLPKPNNNQCRVLLADQS